MPFIIPRRLFRPSALAPPVYLGSTTYRQTSNSSGGRSVSHTTTSETTCLVVVYGFRTGTSIGSQSVTFNGTGLTQATFAKTTGGTPNGGSGIFYMLNPPIGTYTCTVNTTSNQRVNFAAINLTATSFSSLASSSATTSSTATRSLTTTQAAVVIMGSAITTNTSPSTLTGTVIVDDADGAAGYGISYVEHLTGQFQSMSHAYGSSTKKTSAIAAFY